MSSPFIRSTVHYSGTVQGVGFRYSVHRIALSRAVTGYVRNLGDGRVELVLEGDALELSAMMEGVRRVLAAHIHHESSVTSAATGEFTDFRIAR